MSSPLGDRLQKELNTRRSRRAVTISAEAVEALRQRIVECERQRQAYESVYGPGLYGDLGLVFANEAGKPLEPKAFSRRFGRLIRRLGLPRLRFHDTRHTAGTLMIAAGAHAKAVAEQLGDRVETAMNIYGHVLPGIQEDVADRVQGLLDQSSNARFPKDSHSTVH